MGKLSLQGITNKSANFAWFHCFVIGEETYGKKKTKLNGESRLDSFDAIPRYLEYLQQLIHVALGHVVQFYYFDFNLIFRGRHMRLSSA